MTKPLGIREQKLQVIHQDKQNIIHYITINGPTCREELRRQCKISPKQISHRLKILQMDGEIQTVRFGVGAKWALGKQEKINHPKRNKALTLSELPAHLKSWFGYVENFIPPIGRHIRESMPDIPMSQVKYHIGAGSQYHIGELANL